MVSLDGGGSYMRNLGRESLVTAGFGSRKAQRMGLEVLRRHLAGRKAELSDWLELFCRNVASCKR